MTHLSEIVKYEMTKDKKGLCAYFEDGSYYHVHSNERTKLEKWIHKMLRGKK